MTTTKTKQYRIARTNGGDAEIYGLSDTGFDTMDEAMKYVARQPSYVRDTLLVVAPDKVREVVQKAKAYNLNQYLRGHSANIACDYDDARGRLLKLAGNIDRAMARSNSMAIRKGWLATETGLKALFDSLSLLEEIRRVAGGNLTTDEQLRAEEWVSTRPSRRQSTFRNVLRAEIEKELDAKLLEAAEASTHRDEY